MDTQVSQAWTNLEYWIEHTPSAKEKLKLGRSGDHFSYSDGEFVIRVDRKKLIDDNGPAPIVCYEFLWLCVDDEGHQMLTWRTHDMRAIDTLWRLFQEEPLAFNERVLDDEEEFVGVDEEETDEESQRFVQEL